MFPPGLPGLALLLLRVSVAVALLLEAFAHRHALPGWLEVGAILVAMSLCAGYFTPIVAVLAVVSHCAIWLGLGVGDAVIAAAFALDATALALLGPGAYSIDSYRFGRRLVILPPQ
jgi:hypothetical protein